MAGKTVLALWRSCRHFLVSPGQGRVNFVVGWLGTFCATASTVSRRLFIMG